MASLIMSSSRSLARRPITYVSTLTASEPAQRSGYVYCSRRRETVSLDTCAHCPRFVKVVPKDRGGAQDQLHCWTERLALCGDDSAAPLTLARATVGTLMTRNVVCVRPDLGLDASMALFVETGLKALPVVDAEGALMGFVAESDVMLHVQAAGSATQAETIADVFMPYALAVPESTPVTRAAALMALEGQQRVAVVSRENRVVGVLSASDILYWLARADGQLRAPRDERRT